MSKRNIAFVVLFIFGISLLNAFVLVEASNQKNQLSVGAFDQQAIRAERNTYPKRRRNENGRCNIVDRNSTCVEINGYCPL